MAKYTFYRSTEKHFKPERVDEEVVEKKDLNLVPHAPGNWSTLPIASQEYDEETKTLTFYADSFGTFGLASFKYYNLPFQFWELKRVESPFMPAKGTVMLTLVLTKISIEIEITNEGYIPIVQEPKKSKLKYPPIPKRVCNLDELVKILVDANLNIFPEEDASNYVQDHTEKHRAMEVHTYKCMSAFAFTHHFKWSFWNKYTDRRRAIMQVKHLIPGRDLDKCVYEDVMLTPLKASFVQIEEVCGPLTEVQIDVKLSPEDQEVGF
jgi:hypothetical protein